MRINCFRLAAISFICLASTAASYAAIEHILPRPQKLTVKTSRGFPLGGVINIVDETNTPLLKKVFTDAGCTIDPTSAKRVTVSIVSSIEGAYDYPLANYENEAYTINVSYGSVKIEAVTPTGVLRAAQTLAQMAMDEDGTVASALQTCQITDWPAFKLRGWMHDVGRSFIPVSELKAQIDMLARFKVNTFHWHLTDYTGWRLQINAYPQLTSSTAITRFTGSFYTQQDAKEIQDYAAERGVTVIPEIDMPGHSHPFQNAMGHTMLTAQGKAELKVILSEVAELFDKAPYIHIGGDEVSFDDSYIVEMIEYVHSLGKKAVIWNRYNSPAKIVDPKAIPCDMTTNWATSGTLSAGVPNVDMRYNYTNHFDVFADLVGIYKSTIFGVSQGNEDVAGTISAAWNDTMTPTSADIMRQNNIYANVIASASRAWQGGGKQYIEQGGVTLPNSGEEYDDFADWERRFLFHKSTTLASEARLIPYVKQSNVRWYITDQIPNGGSATATFEPENYIGSDLVPSEFTINGNRIGTNLATGAGIYLRHIWHSIVKGFYDNPQASMTAYAWTYVYSPEERDVAALIELYTYSRSGNERAPLAGAWDRRGSRVWFNGSEIAAPTWSQPDAQILQDQNTTGLTNENFTARPPVSLHLRKGWNQVFMKLPHVNSGGTSRDKWQFTFVLTDPTGLNALEDVIYSPTRTLSAEAEHLMSVANDAEAWLSANYNGQVGFLADNDKTLRLRELLQEASRVLTADSDAEIPESLASDIVQAYEDSKAVHDPSKIILPVDGHFYTMHTPLRDSRYLSSRGVGQGLYGEASPTAKSVWQFVKTPGEGYSVSNYSDASYISATAAYNSHIPTVAAEPSTGWVVRPANEVGYVILTSGTSQINQCNAGLNYKIYNWGYSNGAYNTTDTGCKFRFTADKEKNDSITLATVAPLPIDGNDLRITVGLGGINVEGADANRTYVYSITGLLMGRGPGFIRLTPGIYIARCGVLARKISLL